MIKDLVHWLEVLWLTLSAMTPHARNSGPNTLIIDGLLSSLLLKQGHPSIFWLQPLCTASQCFVCCESQMTLTDHHLQQIFQKHAS